MLVGRRQMSCASPFQVAIQEGAEEEEAGGNHDFWGVGDVRVMRTRTSWPVVGDGNAKQDRFKDQGSTISLSLAWTSSPQSKQKSVKQQEKEGQGRHAVASKFPNLSNLKTIPRPLHLQQQEQGY